MKNAFLAEKKGLKQAALASVTAATVNGDRISLKDATRVAIVLQIQAAASAVLSVALKQHDAATAGNSKALSVANAYFHKVDAATSFTKVEPVAAFDTLDLFPIVDTDKAVVVLEVLEADLDVNANFDHISVDIVGDATARIVSALYVTEADLAPAYAQSL